MEIFQFEQFQMIAECGTMREAAERLFLSQPTLSHNLKKLESELGRTTEPCALAPHPPRRPEDNPRQGARLSVRHR